MFSYDFSFPSHILISFKNHQSLNQLSGIWWFINVAKYLQWYIYVNDGFSPSFKLYELRHLRYSKAFHMEYVISQLVGIYLHGKN